MARDLIGYWVILTYIAIRIGNFILVEVSEQFESAPFAGTPAMLTFLAPAAHDKFIWLLIILITNYVYSLNQSVTPNLSYNLKFIYY